MSWRRGKSKGSTAVSKASGTVPVPANRVILCQRSAPGMIRSYGNSVMDNDVRSRADAGGGTPVFRGKVRERSGNSFWGVTPITDLRLKYLGSVSFRWHYIGQLTWQACNEDLGHCATNEYQCVTEDGRIHSPPTCTLLHPFFRYLHPFRIVFEVHTRRSTA